MKSMTGFGSATGSATTADIEVTLKSINGRFLEIKSYMPPEYLPIENEIKEILQSHFHRGSLNLHVNRHIKSNANSPSYVVDTAKAKEWVASYKKLGVSLKLKGAPDLETVARIPEVIRAADSPLVTNEEKKKLLKIVEEAAQSCLGERVREGKSLAKALLKIVDELRSYLGKIESFQDKTNEEIRKNFTKKMEKLLTSETVDRDRLHYEIAYLIDKADITEEVERLKEHLKVYESMLKGPTSQGKKLDFYVQELHREINTIGSKSPLPEMTRAVVEAKTLIEQLKEQVQNVE